MFILDIRSLYDVQPTRLVITVCYCHVTFCLHQQKRVLAYNTHLFSIWSQKIFKPICFVVNFLPIISYQNLRNLMLAQILSHLLILFYSTLTFCFIEHYRKGGGPRWLQPLMSPLLAMKLDYCFFSILCVCFFTSLCFLPFLHIYSPANKFTSIN